MARKRDRRAQGQAAKTAVDGRLSIGRRVFWSDYLAVSSRPIARFLYSPSCCCAMSDSKVLLDVSIEYVSMLMKPLDFCWLYTYSEYVTGCTRNLLIASIHSILHISTAVRFIQWRMSESLDNYTKSYMHRIMLFISSTLSELR